MTPYVAYPYRDSEKVNLAVLRDALPHHIVASLAYYALDFTLRDGCVESGQPGWRMARYVEGALGEMFVREIRAAITAGGA